MHRRNFCKLGAAGIGVLAIAEPARAFQFVDDKKWAVVYGSQCGSTRDYANAINDGLGGIADVLDVATITPKVDDYEFFIIGGWRNGNSVNPEEITKFVLTNISSLKDKIKGMFVVLGNGGNATLTSEHTDFLNQMLINKAGVNESLGKVFFGKSDPACNGMGFSYNNVKKEEGVAFGKKILGEITGITNPTAGSRYGFKLSRCTHPLSRLSTINYTIPYDTNVLLTIFSVRGQKIETLISQRQNAGSYKVQWNESNLASGYYLYQLKAGGLVETQAARIIN